MAQRYLLEKPLAAGGMGTIWVAKHLLLDVPVAMKFMSDEVDDSASGRMRFEREAKAAARIASPHVARVYDYGVEDGTPFIAMELLTGESLEARLRRDVALAPKEASKIMRQIQKGLSEAHTLGIVHRDLKPANIFLAKVGEEEVVKILDFGIAKETKNLADDDDRTKSGTVLGSPHHMSPEQARGGDIDTRSDLWSLGVVLFRALTGEKPFAGTNMGDIIAKICGDAIPAPSSFAPWLGPSIDAFFERALRRNPELRFQSVREMAEAFDEAIGVVVAPPESSRRAQVVADSSSVVADSVIMPRADVTRDVAARTSIADTEPTAIGTTSDKPLRQSEGARQKPRLAFSALVLIVVAGTVVFSWMRFGPHSSATTASSSAEKTGVEPVPREPSVDSQGDGASQHSDEIAPALTTTAVVTMDPIAPSASAAETVTKPTNRLPLSPRRPLGRPKSKGDPFF